MSKALSAYVEAQKVLDQHIQHLSKRVDNMMDQYDLEFKFIFDKKKQYVYANFLSSYYLGLPQSDFEHKSWRELGFPAAIMESVEQDLDQVFYKADLVTGEHKATIKRAGGTCYYKYTLSPFFDETGQVEAVICTIRKVLAAQIKLEQVNQAKLFNYVMNFCPAGMVLVDSQERVIAISQVYFKRYLGGFNPSETIGKPAVEVCKRLGFEWKNSPVYQSLKGKEVRNKVQRWANRSSIASAAPIYDELGRVAGALGIYYEITDYENMKEHLAKMDRLNLISEMAKGVAHEIRNPLTVVKGYLQNFQRKVPFLLNEHIPILLSELEAIEKIISNFLYLARNKISEQQWGDLGQTVQSIYPLIYASALERGVKVKVILPDKLPLVFYDEKEIKQLTLHLVQNSLEAMYPEGQLLIKVSYNENEVFLSVADTGSGITKAYKEKIFDPFFTTKDNCSGLGLAICASIAERHGAILTIHSRNKRGTKATVHFPRSNKKRLARSY